MFHLAPLRYIVLPKDFELALVVKELKGKNLEEVIAVGKDKLGSMAAGGGSHE